MIKIKVTPPTTSEWQKWVQKCAAKTQADIKGFKVGSKPKITSLYKKQKKFFTSGNGVFKGKCVFCETLLANQHGDVEHYRPKGAVEDQRGKRVKVKYGSREIEHPGYYWLAYQWANLMPSCVRCNQYADGFGKGNRFPVKGPYAAEPGKETGEKPLLLNPTKDDPDAHLRFDDNWILSGKTKRGQVTIDVLGLNHRDLPRQRLEKAKDVRGRILTKIAMLGEGSSSDAQLQKTRSEIAELQSDAQDFTAVCKAVVAERKSQYAFVLG